MFMLIKLEFSGSEILVEPLEKADELTFIFMEGEKKAEISDVSDKSKKIDNDVFLSMWDRFINLDFSKILQENLNNEGLDGYTLTIHVGSVMNELAVTLWCPSESKYSEQGCTESAALMKLVNQMMSLAKENGLKTRF